MSIPFTDACLQVQKKTRGEKGRVQKYVTTQHLDKGNTILKLYS